LKNGEFLYIAAKEL